MQSNIYPSKVVVQAAPVLLAVAIAESTNQLILTLCHLIWMVFLYVSFQRKLMTVTVLSQTLFVVG